MVKANLYTSYKYVRVRTLEVHSSGRYVFILAAFKSVQHPCILKFQIARMRAQSSFYGRCTLDRECERKRNDSLICRFSSSSIAYLLVLAPGSSKLFYLIKSTIKICSTPLAFTPNMQPDMPKCATCMVTFFLGLNTT